MVWRTVIGTHSSGQIGLFVSKPGVDAFGADPGDRNQWLFSSAIDKQANFIQSGRCNLNDTVSFPDTGAVPFVWFDLYSGSTGMVQEAETVADGTATYTVYRCSHPSTSTFQIIRQAGTLAPPSGSFFRYIVFTVSQDG